MTRPARSVHDIVVDEVSLVDRPANQYAAVVIAKNAGGVMPEDDAIEIYDAEGNPIDEDAQLEDGTLVYGPDGTAYEWTTPDEGALQEEGLALAKGASPFQPAGAATTVIGKSLAETFREELAKAQAAGGDAVNGVIARMADALATADQRAQGAEQIAKAEQSLRLEREYIAKAAEYNLPVAAEELGPVLKRCHELLPEADCVVLNKVFNAAGSMLFTELGFEGGGTADGSDPMAEIDAAAANALAKAAGAGGVTAGAEHVAKAAAAEAYYNQSPAEYDRYIAGLRN